MGPLLFVLLLVLPLVELWVLIQVGGEIGVLPTILLLLGVSIAGAALLKREGMATWSRLQETIRRGAVPTSEVADGALILLGGAFLVTPGFITDAVGLLLVFPPTRRSVKSLFRRSAGAFARKRFGAAGYVASAGRRTYEARVARRQTTPPQVTEIEAPTRPPDEV